VASAYDGEKQFPSAREEFYIVNDTVRIERPLLCRRQEDLGGRPAQDTLGNTVKVKTRVQDVQGEFTGSWLTTEGNEGPVPTE
jgi:hypothetical protein